MEKHDTYYDELKQIGTDFADAEEVATCDERQFDNVAEDRELLHRLDLRPMQAGLDLESTECSDSVNAHCLARKLGLQ